MSKLYGDLDFLHPFKEGNSRTLRAFTTQLAKAAGYALDWTWSGADAQSPDRLYRARDKEVNARAFPGLDQARAAKTDNRVEYEAWVYVLARYRESPDLQTLVREATFSERDLQAARAFKQAATPAELEKAAWRFPVVRPAVERLRLAELFANEKIRDPSSRANFLVDVRERLVKDLSRGKALAEPQRIIDAQREL